MKECPMCGAEAPEDAAYCPRCGKRMDGKKKCPACNALLNEDDAFCPVCGRRQTKEVKEETEKKEPVRKSSPQIRTYYSNKPLSGGGVGFLMAFFLSLPGFILVLCLGDEEAKRVATITFIVEAVIVIILAVVIVVTTCAATNRYY